ncbi:HhH-GPD-type base excision DNA repair protein [Streptomyces sp. NPDC049916]|uniref:HhH-GPD-type base excision DNA repair protein n=1 Tax=Streptomyces sp. NPDC049916 TaxID=3155156 RepID=UPI003425D4E2
MTISDSASDGNDSARGFGRGVDLRIAQQPEADALLARSPLAALVGMLLDQQVPMEWAFTGPYTLAGRMGSDDLDAGRIAAQDPEEFAELFTTKPALHRYPGSMAQRVQQLCRYLVAEYGGDASAVWRDAASGADLLERLKALPGFGEQKARIFLALLGKQYGVRPPGWREAAGAYGATGSRRSVADITGPTSLAEVRAYKQEAKAAAKAEKATAGTTAKKTAGGRATGRKKTPKGAAPKRESQ